jgi:hypothetical protein
MHTDSQLHTTRFVRKVSTSSTAAGVLIVIGLFAVFFIHWILGLFLMVLGAALSGSSKKISFCGECGNEVANTSRLCPYCHATFDRVQKVPMSRGLLYATLGSLSVIAIAGAAMWWIINHANR